MPFSNPAGGNYFFTLTTDAPIALNVFAQDRVSENWYFLDGTPTGFGTDFDPNFLAYSSGQASENTYGLEVKLPSHYHDYCNHCANGGPGYADGFYFRNDVRVTWGGAPVNFTLTLDRVDSVPEPATWALMLIGFGSLGAGIRRRRYGAAASA